MISNFNQSTFVGKFDLQSPDNELVFERTVEIIITSHCAFFPLHFRTLNRFYAPLS